MHALAKWALGVAQFVTIALLAWFGSTLLTVHEQIELNTYKLNQVQQSATIITNLQTQVAQLQWEMSNMQQRQAKDDAYRESHK